MTARDRILANLQKNAPHAAELRAPLLDLACDIQSSPESRVQSLITHLEAAHAEIHRVTANEVSAAVISFCEQRKFSTLLLPGGDFLYRIPTPNGDLRVTRFDRPIEAFKTELFNDIDAGLTVADCAIADTGTLVLSSSAMQPRTLSLVPPIHICLLDATRLHATLSSAMAAEGWAQAMPTNLLFISGPSKTADIQQTLAYGAHGPKELHVFLIGGEA